MKVKTEGRFKLKKLSKKTKIGLMVGTALVVGVSALIGINKVKNKGTFYTKLNEFSSITACDFRYVLNVRSSANSASNSLEDFLDGMQDEVVGMNSEYQANTSDNYVVPDGDSTGSLYKDHIQTDWVSQDGSYQVDWDKPNYELKITGRLESLEPFTAQASLSLTTDYIDAPFLNMTAIDGKCYFDIKTLRAWLINSGDTSLVQLGKTIPENVVYISVDEGDELHYGTGFAELDELEASGGSELSELYWRIKKVGQLLASGIQNSMGSAGLSNDETRYRLNISGEDALNLLAGIRGILNNSGAYYDSYVNNLNSSGVINGIEAGQMVNEKDNFLYAIHPLWSAFNTMSTEDAQNTNLVVVGKARNYNSGGVPYYEINLGTNFKLNGIDYIVSLYGCKSGLGNTGSQVRVPDNSITGVSAVDVDFSSMTDYLLSYFKLAPAYPSYRLDANWANFNERGLREFAELVNEENKREGFEVPYVHRYNVQEFIDTYSQMTESEYSASPATKFNYELVRRFLGSIEPVQKDKSEEAVEVKVTGNDLDALYDGISFKFRNADMPTLNHVVVDLSASVDLGDMNVEGAVSKELDLTKFNITDSSGNKYPCNHEDFIREANIGISPEDILTKLEVTKDATDAKLHFIVKGYGTYTLNYDKFIIGELITE